MISKVRFILRCTPYFVGECSSASATDIRTEATLPTNIHFISTMRLFSLWALSDYINAHSVPGVLKAIIIKNPPYRAEQMEIRSLNIYHWLGLAHRPG
jgi:hypothetical protein